MGPFAPVQVVDQAVYNRLARAAGVMRAFFEQVSAWMSEQMAGLEDRRLAPWASQVLALDESTLDAVGRWLPALRHVVPGDPRLLAGRISALFDVRRQQWVRVEVWQEAVANCKAQARHMVEGLQAGTLLLFDRGYLSFPWFDELSERGLWWISRYANHASYHVRHVLDESRLSASGRPFEHDRQSAFMTRGEDADLVLDGDVVRRLSLWPPDSVVE